MPYSPHLKKEYGGAKERKGRDMNELLCKGAMPGAVIRKRTKERSVQKEGREGKGYGKMEKIGVM